MFKGDHNDDDDDTNNNDDDDDDDDVMMMMMMMMMMMIIIIIIKVFINHSLRKQTCNNLHGKKMNKGKRKNTLIKRLN